MKHHKEIVEYFNERGVSAIFLFRRNLLRRMISVLANSYDSQAKLLNGTHKSHVHSPHEVALRLSLSLLCSLIVCNGLQAKILANYKPKVNATVLVSNLKEAVETTAKALEYFKSTYHVVLYYEDIVRNRTVRFDHEIIS